MIVNAATVASTTVASNAKNILQAGIVSLVAASYSNIKARFNTIKEQTAEEISQGLMDCAQRFIQGQSMILMTTKHLRR